PGTGKSPHRPGGMEQSGEANETDFMRIRAPCIPRALSCRMGGGRIDGAAGDRGGREAGRQGRYGKEGEAASGGSALLAAREFFNARRGAGRYRAHIAR